MHILIVANGFPPRDLGGVESYSQSLARGLQQRGLQVSVFCRASDLGLPDGQALDGWEDGLRVLRVVNDNKRIASFAESYSSPLVEQVFTGCLDELRPDLVHFNHLAFLSVGLPAAAAARRIPAVTTLHDFWPLCQRVNLLDWQGRACPGPLHGVDCAACVSGGGSGLQTANRLSGLARWVKRFSTPALRRRLRAWLPGAAGQASVLQAGPEIFDRRFQVFSQSLQLTSLALAPSEFVRRQYLANGFPAGRLQVLPLGIEIEPGADHPALPVPPLDSQTSPGDPAALRAGYIGAFLPSKGLDLLLQAFRRLEAPHARLLIYGRQAGAPPHYLRQLTAAAAGDPRIVFQGEFPPARRAAIYRGLDVLVVPSRVPESFSLVAREALAAGVPVIAANTGALPEAVTDGVNGFLFDAGDADRLADLLRRAAQPGLLGRLTCPGPLEVLTPAEHAARVEQVYRQALRSAGEAA